MNIVSFTLCHSCNTQTRRLNCCITNAFSAVHLALSESCQFIWFSEQYVWGGDTKYTSLYSHLFLLILLLRPLLPFLPLLFVFIYPSATFLFRPHSYLNRCRCSSSSFSLIFFFSLYPYFYSSSSAFTILLFSFILSLFSPLFSSTSFSSYIFAPFFVLFSSFYFSSFSSFFTFLTYTVVRSGTETFTILLTVLRCSINRSWRITYSAITFGIHVVQRVQLIASEVQRCLLGRLKQGLTAVEATIYFKTHLYPLILRVWAASPWRHMYCSNLCLAAIKSRIDLEL